MKNMRLPEQSPLSIFVRERLAELGMRQSEFCRLTGFDQGLLSKIQSSMITNLSLESALRLASGLCVSPRKILTLIDRMDLHELILASYSGELAEAPLAEGQEMPGPVLDVSRMAMQAHRTNHSLAAVIRMLYPMVQDRENQASAQTGGQVY